MSETRDAVDRLCWLCEEAENRAREEIGTDFTRELSPLEWEMKKLVGMLFEAKILKWKDSVPFKVQVEQIPETDERFTRCAQIKSVVSMEPLGTGLSSTMLSSDVWVDRSAGIVSTRFFGADELRKRFCQRMRQWIRFLTAESEKLGTSLPVEADSPSKGTTGRTHGIKDSESLRFDKEYCETFPTTPEQRKLVQLIASEKNRLSTDDKRLKTFNQNSLQVLETNHFVIRGEAHVECTPNGLYLVEAWNDLNRQQSLDVVKNYVATRTKPEVQTVTVESICKELSPHERGRKTLKRILELTKDGKTPSQIATQNPGKRGFSLSNISERLKEVRERFPGFLPDEVR